MFGFRQGSKCPIPKGILRLQSSFPVQKRRTKGVRIVWLRQNSWEGTTHERIRQQPSPGQLPFSTVMVSAVCGTTTAWHDHPSPRGLGMGYQSPTIWKSVKGCGVLFTAVVVSGKWIWCFHAWLHWSKSLKIHELNLIGLTCSCVFTNCTFWDGSVGVTSSLTTVFYRKHVSISEIPSKIHLHWRNQMPKHWQNRLFLPCHM